MYLTLNIIGYKRMLQKCNVAVDDVAVDHVTTVVDVVAVDDAGSIRFSNNFLR